MMGIISSISQVRKLPGEPFSWASWIDFCFLRLQTEAVNWFPKSLSSSLRGRTKPREKLEADGWEKWFSHEPEKSSRQPSSPRTFRLPLPRPFSCLLIWPGPLHLHCSAWGSSIPSWGRRPLLYVLEEDPYDTFSVPFKLLAEFVIIYQ